ncbi:MAG: polyprenyl synthetase family protein [Anaerolineae bacterium]|nr:polyprenyl synthetase family protein [Anaerolineae bacterium]
MNRLPFLAPIENDLARVESILQEHPPEQNEAIGAAIDYLVGGGGKRLRPALALLSCRICDASPEWAVFAAAALEMLHTATLIHDDLIDGALVRRGTETLNARWTPGATVLAGDYIFARSAHLGARTGSVRFTRRFAETLMVICNGEIRQMFSQHRGAITRQEYEQRIYAKTASLIGLAAEAGAILSDADVPRTQALRTYGERLGLAFQVVDDVLDFVADRELLGKPVGSDLRQGLVTLPLLLFLELEPQHPLVQRTLQAFSPADVDEVVGIVAASPAIDQALEIAASYCEQARSALTIFPPGVYHTALLELVDFTIRRQF